MHSWFQRARTEELEIELEDGKIEIKEKIIANVVRESGARFLAELTFTFRNYIFPNVPENDDEVFLMFADPRIKNWLLNFEGKKLEADVAQKCKKVIEKLTRTSAPEREDLDLTQTQDEDVEQEDLEGAEI